MLALHRLPTQQPSLRPACTPQTLDGFRCQWVNDEPFGAVLCMLAIWQTPQLVQPALKDCLPAPQADPTEMNGDYLVPAHFPKLVPKRKHTQGIP